MPSARERFDSQMARCCGLVELNAKLSRAYWRRTGERIREDQLSELLRSALVLAVSALDSYFTDKFVERFIPYYRKHGPTKSVVRFLEDAGMDVRAALELIPISYKGRPYRKLRTFVERYLERYVATRMENVDKLFKVMGVKSLSRNSQGKAGRKTLVKRIAKAIERRHTIVHKGDLTSHGKLRPIGQTWTKNRLSDIKLFVRMCDDILDNALR